MYLRLKYRKATIAARVDTGGKDAVAYDVYKGKQWKKMDLGGHEEKREIEKVPYVPAASTASASPSIEPKSVTLPKSPAFHTQAETAAAPNQCAKARAADAEFSLLHHQPEETHRILEEQHKNTSSASHRNLRPHPSAVRRSPTPSTGITRRTRSPSSPSASAAFEEMM